MNLGNVIAEDCCIHLQENNKTEVLIELMERVCGKGYVRDLDSLKKEIFYREQLMSTGIGMGIGIPHVRFKGLERPVVAVGIKQNGISDYDTIDGEDIRIIVMILVGEQQHKEHIRLLSQVMDKLKEKDCRDRLIRTEEDGEIFALLAGEAEDA